MYRYTLNKIWTEEFNLLYQKLFILFGMVGISVEPAANEKYLNEHKILNTKLDIHFF
jgi:hypothetical protein